jgi:formate-dependent nitrite reductase cytochrome c552 subunit
MVNPFDDLQFTCGSCHPGDWQQKAASYGAK